MTDIEFLPLRWWAALKREWMLYHLGLPEFRFMFEPAPPNEWVSLDCETTGLNVGKDEIISIGAVRIVGNRIMTSERLELLVRPERGVSAESVKIHRLRERDVADGLPIEEAMKQLLRFIGSRPLVGYFLELDVAMVNKALFLKPRPRLKACFPSSAGVMRSRSSIRWERSRGRNGRLSWTP